MSDLSINPAAASGAAAATKGQAQGQAAGFGGGAKELSERFLTLLVAQMKNQDPLNPTDNSQITSQIAQINTVTGINGLNDALDRITGQISTSQRLQASNLIGRGVLVEGDSVKVGDKAATTPFGVDLPEPAASMTVEISDEAGNILHRSTHENVAAGVESFQWDGMDASDTPAGPGSYHLSITAKDAAGDVIPAKTLSTGYVGGVVNTPQGPRLDLGPGGLIDLDSVYQIL